MKTASFSQAALNDVLMKTLNDRVWGTIGPESVAAAKELAALLGREAGLLCSSHAGATETILRALEISFDDEVILPSFCSPFLKEAVLAVGAKCVFCDVDENLTMDPRHLDFCVTEHTQAIFCEQSAGYVCDMEKLRAAAAAHDLPLIEVSASPYCTRFKDRPTAQYADFSLCALPLQGVGAIVTDAAFLGKLYAAHHCGNPYGQAGGLNTGVCLGGDMRADEFRCAALREFLTRADELRRQKNSVRIRLTEALLEAGALPRTPLKDTDTAGDYILCSAVAREACRDKTAELPGRAHNEQARLALAGVRAYAVL